MNKELFPHENFLELNAPELKKIELPGELQKRITGFEELKEGLDFTQGEDKPELEEKLESLSHEIVEDLEDFLAHHIENNDEIEERDEQIKEQQEETQLPIIQKPLIMEPKIKQEEALLEDQQGENTNEQHSADAPQQPKEEQPVPEQSEEKQEAEKPAEPEKELIPEKTEPTDEEILQLLWNDKKHLLHHNEIKARGFKAQLNDRKINVGKFCLHKGKFDRCYTLFIRRFK